MSTATSLAFFPNIDGDTFGDALTAFLAAEGEQIVQRGQQSADRPLPDHVRGAGLRTVSWTHQTLAGMSHAAVVVEETLEPWGRWNPRMIGKLSGGTGGFAAAVEIIRSADQYGLGLFYAGRTIEIVQCDSDGKVWQRGTTYELARAVCDDTAAYDRYLAWCAALTGEHPSVVLRSSEAMRSYCTVAAPRPAPHAGLGVAHPATPLSRVVLAGADEATFRRVIADPALRQAHGQGWRWIADCAPFAGLPYVMLERHGPLDETLAATLAVQLGFTLGIGIAGEGRPFHWIRIDPDGVAESGQSSGADALIEQCAAFSVTLGEAPDMLCWKPQRTGQLLT